MTNPLPPIVRLARSGVSLVIAVPADGLPSVVHWGAEVADDLAREIVATADPAVMNSSLDRPRRFGIAPGFGDGWSGTPALEWHAAGIPAAGLRVVAVRSGPDTASVELLDPRLGVTVVLDYAIDAGGVLAVRGTVTNGGDGIVDVGGVRHLLPVPARASELLDQTGRWSGERRPQRRAIVDGTTLRSSRRGRPGHDSPLVSIVGTANFGFRTGEVWATHVAFSGNVEYVTERLPEGAGSLSAVVGGGELLLPGEVRLAPGESYAGPEVLFVWSDAGIDGVSARFHARVRRSPSHPSTPRPLVLNTWEAVYFDHDIERLTLLAHEAGALGVERFVLDDGWFLGRRGDTAGLGDWSVDPIVWPHGLGELSGLVHALGMQFGLWFEPEMVNLDSDLARAHPEWLLAGPGGTELPSRNQFVLDLSRPEVYDHLLSVISRVIADAGVDFLKWDHNRDLHVAEGPGGFRVHEQTLAVYRLMDALRAAHPGLEIESCASGGGRVDLGVMEHAQRVWASDTNDPVERQMVQRWTGVLLPPEVVGSHVGPAEAHTTHRVSSLPFRLVTALFAHAGIEQDITRVSAEERSALRAWAGLYREFRALLASGVTVRADDIDLGALLHGVVAPDGREALFAWVRIESSATAHSERVVLPGLDPDRSYRLVLREELGVASRHEIADPGWLSTDAAEAVTVSGRLLGGVGVPLPVLNPGSALLIQLTAVD